MRTLGFILRILLLIAIFGVVGVWTAQWMIAREVARGKPEYEVRLAAYTGGLFAGGSVATVVGVLMLLSGGSPARRTPNNSAKRR